MVDLVVTAASVVAGATATSEPRIALATITAGQALYRDTTTERVGLADNNSATAAIREVFGIALNGGGVGQPIRVLTAGPYTSGATMAAATVYYLGDTPGAICTVAGLGVGEFPTIIGISFSTTVLDVRLHAAGVAL